MRSPITKEQLTMFCFACAAVISGRVQEPTLIRSLLQAFLGLGFTIYCQDLTKRPKMTRLLQLLSGFLILYIGVRIGIAAYVSIKPS